MWETAKVQFLQSAERHDGEWLRRGDPGGVPKIFLLDEVEEFSALLRAKRLICDWSMVKVIIDSDWLPRGLRIEKVGGACPVGYFRI
ncbi:hypothetical protein TNCV_3095341 [Trichonephila clavipes]|uniref:Uncharacterized protein n=1 Tax=Trichonephila clavipes TaxID=2585209 RepID=A0A8X6WGC4_TRICX|nr:hypothetical protein TNCV_3095341 [Trichonephila clavipes]